MNDQINVDLIQQILKIKNKPFHYKQDDSLTLSISNYSNILEEDFINGTLINPISFSYFQNKKLSKINVIRNNSNKFQILGNRSSNEYKFKRHVTILNEIEKLTEDDLKLLGNKRDSEEIVHKINFLTSQNIENNHLFDKLERLKEIQSNILIDNMKDNSGYKVTQPMIALNQSIEDDFYEEDENDDFRDYNDYDNFDDESDDNYDNDFV